MIGDDCLLVVGLWGRGAGDLRHSSWNVVHNQIRQQEQKVTLVFQIYTILYSEIEYIFCHFNNWVKKNRKDKKKKIYFAL